MRTSVWQRMKGEAVVAMAAALVLGLATPEPAGAGEDDAWDAERAFLEMERLQAEVGVLRALADAQAALLAWNRARTETLGPGTLVPETRVPGTLVPPGGAGPAVLAPHLCTEEVLAPWCRALPATFGEDAPIASDDEQAGDGRR